MPLMKTYNRLPFAPVRGEGVWLMDAAGRRYLDAISGIGVSNLGHAHPVVTEAIRNQAQILLHCSNLFTIPQQEDCADRLCEITGMSAVFFCNSGTEANEAAIKLARRFGHEKGIDIPIIVSMQGSFHGRSLGALSATANPACRQGFDPLLDGFTQVLFNDLPAIEALLNSAEYAGRVAAILVEPIQGEGGVRIPDKGYLTGLRTLCDRHDCLLMLDEVQTGMGRTGAWLASQHEDIMADVVTMAKALGNGIPVGACLTAGSAQGLFQPGMHGTTFGGNPLACATAIATIKAIDEGGFLENASILGDFIRRKLKEGLSDCDGVVAVRGQGLMIGIELDRPCSILVQKALERGVLINVTAGQVIRLLPPLILQEKEAEFLVATLIDLIRGFVYNES